MGISSRKGVADGREQAVELLAEKRAKGPVKRTATRKAPAKKKATAKK